VSKPTAVIVLTIALATTSVAAQTRDARVIVTVVDMTGAILPGATVVITPREPAGATGVTGTANDAGVATVTGLPPGRYNIKAEFPGFDAFELEDVRLRAGDNKQQLELDLTGFTDTVEVGQDPQAAAADPNNTLSTMLTNEEIEALSDDPNELMRQLVEMAGGAARVRVDGFNGGQLPSRDVIRSIRIVRDTFPAENHSAENDGIDIVTQAGIGPIRGGFSTRVRDSMLGGSNPFVDVKAPPPTPPSAAASNRRCSGGARTTVGTSIRCSTTTSRSRRFSASATRRTIRRAAISASAVSISPNARMRTRRGATSCACRRRGRSGATCS
jgi:hypothetical protein